MYEFLLETSENWEDLLYEVFDTGIPGKAEWQDAATICRILDTLAPAAAWIGPDGAQTPQTVRLSPEAGSLLLAFPSGSVLARSVKLRFQRYGSLPAQSCLRLETENLRGAYWLLPLKTAQALQSAGLPLPNAKENEEEWQQHLLRIENR